MKRRTPRRRRRSWSPEFAAVLMLLAVGYLAVALVVLVVALLSPEVVLW
jgi:hypothetical protein